MEVFGGVGGNVYVYFGYFHRQGVSLTILSLLQVGNGKSLTASYQSYKGLSSSWK